MLFFIDVSIVKKKITVRIKYYSDDISDCFTQFYSLVAYYMYDTKFAY